MEGISSSTLHLILLMRLTGREVLNPKAGEKPVDSKYRTEGLMTANHADSQFVEKGDRPHRSDVTAFYVACFMAFPSHLPDRS